MKQQHQIKKWFINLRGEKLYLSTILDTYGRYIVSYDISRSPNLGANKQDVKFSI